MYQLCLFWPFFFLFKTIIDPLETVCFQFQFAYDDHENKLDYERINGNDQQQKQQK